MRVSCSAPGKLVLIGEYSVLWGHPALVAAVDRRARVELSPTGGPDCRVAAPGLRDEALTFTLGRRGAVAWDRPEQALPLVTALLPAMSRRRLPATGLAPFDARLDTTAFFAGRGGVKLGLGSSAAVTTALATALAAWGGSPGPSPVGLEELVGFHRAVQGGRGSGIDIAAALLGGVVEYRLDKAGGVACARPLALPADLSVLFVWTGRAADTGSFLAGLEHGLRTDRSGVEGALHRLGAVAASVVDAVRQGRTGDVLFGVDTFWDGLEALGAAAGLDILSDAHRDLRRVVAAHGGHYKPSGAGGGDAGLAFLPGEGRNGAVAAAVREAGYGVLDVNVEPAGLKMRLA